MTSKRVDQVPFSEHFGTVPRDEYQALLLLLYHLTSAGKIARDIEQMDLSRRLSGIGALGPAYAEWLTEAITHAKEAALPSGSITSRLGNLTNLLLEIVAGDRDALQSPTPSVD